MRYLLIVFALSQIVVGVLLWVTPGFFYDEIGPYGPRNDHYMGDLATWYLALGGLVLASVRQVSWRVPVLALAFAQNTLHAVNHLLDVNEADPSWLGPFNLITLALVSAMLAWMLTRENRAARA
jgi:hypothetical protein